MVSKTRNVHVVVVPYPSQGHINPLLQFGKRLASKGVKATVATTKYTVNSIVAPNVTVEPISDGFDDAGFAQAKNVDLFLKSFRSNGSKTLSRLIEKFEHSDFPVTCVVYDSFLPWALEVAKRHGVHGAAFFTNSAAVCSMFCRIHHGSLWLPVKMEDLPLSIPGLPPLNCSDLPSFIRLPESYPAYLAMKLSQFSNLEKADWIFANTFEELESEVVKELHGMFPAKLIGPMVPSGYLDGRISGDKGYGANLWKPLSEECIKWLESKPPRSVVYISFGSMVSLTQEQTQELAQGLEETGKNFLWVLRESEHTKLPKGFKDSVKEKGLVITWCNQLEVLAHEAVGCFVTHCGWNSTMEGLSLGMPMVGVPQWADQVTDAKFAEDVWTSSTDNNTMPPCSASNSDVIHIVFTRSSCDIATSRSNNTVGEVDHDPPPRLSGVDFIASLHTIYGYLIGLLLTLTGIEYQGSSTNLFSKHPTLVMLFLIAILVYIISLISLRRLNHMSSNHSSKLMHGVCHICGAVACELLLLVLVSPVSSLVINLSSLTPIAMLVLCYKYLLRRISDAEEEGTGISQSDAGYQDQASQMEMGDLEAAA